jgi:hypothetical protein
VFQKLPNKIIQLIFIQCPAISRSHKRHKDEKIIFIFILATSISCKSSNIEDSLREIKIHKKEVLQKEINTDYFISAFP